MQIPVFSESGNCRCHSDNTTAKYKEIPITDKFLLDLSSTFCNAERPREQSTPNIAKVMPPNTGSGTDVITAPNFPIIAKTTAIIPEMTSTILLPI